MSGNTGRKENDSDLIHANIECEVVLSWFHLECVGISKTEYVFINKHNKFHWYCDKCIGYTIDILKSIREMDANSL